MRETCKCDICMGGATEPQQAHCFDCLLPYSEWVDLIVQNEVWEEINPSSRPGGGSLCPNCIGKRIKEAGLEKVECVFVGEK